MLFWRRLVLVALGEADPGPPGPIKSGSMEVWRDLQEWSEHAPPPPAGHRPVTEDEARETLAMFLDDGAEARPSQADYAAAAAEALEDEGKRALGRAVVWPWWRREPTRAKP